MLFARRCERKFGGRLRAIIVCKLRIALNQADVRSYYKFFKYASFLIKKYHLCLHKRIFLSKRLVFARKCERKFGGILCAIIVCKLRIALNQADVRNYYKFFKYASFLIKKYHLCLHKRIFLSKRLVFARKCERKFGGILCAIIVLKLRIAHNQAESEITTFFSNIQVF